MRFLCDYFIIEITVIEILSLSKTTCQSGDEVAGFPSPWRQGHINWFPPCEASSFMGSKHFDKNVLKSQETYDWFSGMLYLCNVVQERITHRTKHSVRTQS